HPGGPGGQPGAARAPGRGPGPAAAGHRHQADHGRAAVPAGADRRGLGVHRAGLQAEPLPVRQARVRAPVRPERRRPHLRLPAQDPRRHGCGRRGSAVPGRRRRLRLTGPPQAAPRGCTCGCDSPVSQPQAHPRRRRSLRGLVRSRCGVARLVPIATGAGGSPPGSDEAHVPRGRPPGPRGSPDDASPSGGSMTQPTTDVQVQDQALIDVDPEIAAVLDGELARQRDTLEMIASENFVPRAVLQAAGSVLTNKYAEGYPGKRYYGGCEQVDIAENLAIDRARSLFGAAYANVQPHSGATANAAVLHALATPGDTILGLQLAH